MSESRAAAFGWWSLLAAVICGLAMPARAFGQAVGQITGVVRDAARDGVAGARLAVDGSSARAVSAADGSYELRAVPAGAVRVVVHRLGFRADTAVVQVAENATARQDFVLAEVPRRLSVVAVRDSSAPEPYDGRLAGFEQRAQHGLGHFITRKQIDANPNSRLIDALRRIPGVRVVTLRGSAGRSVVLGGANCPPTVFIDGFAATAGAVDLDMIDLNSAEGVEVYTGSSSIPADLLPPQGQERCGVIAVWQRPARPPMSSSAAAAAEDVAALVAAGAVLTSDQVDVAASYEEGSAAPVYPPALAQAKIAGRAVLEFIVDTTGHVEPGSVGVVSATRPEFADAAREAIGRARFVPASVSTRLVRQLVQAPFDFTPNP